MSNFKFFFLKLAQKSKSKLGLNGGIVDKTSIQNMTDETTQFNSTYLMDKICSTFRVAVYTAVVVANNGDNIIMIN